MQRLARGMTFLALLTLLGGLGFAPAGTARAVTGSVTVTVYDCPTRMTSETLVPESCLLATEGSDLTLGYGEGEGVTLGVDDAVFDGRSYTWNDLPISATPMAFSAYERSLPDGYIDNVVTSDGETFTASPWGAVRLSTATPSGALSFYSFTEAAGGGQARLVIKAEQCLPGYDGDEPDRDCGGNPRSDLVFMIGDVVTATTDKDGIAELAVVPGGLWVRAIVPEPIVRIIYEPRHLDGRPAEFELVDNGIVLAGPEAPNGIHHRDQVVLHVYIVPERGFGSAAYFLKARDCRDANPSDWTTCVPIPGVTFRFDYDGTEGRSSREVTTNSHGEISSQGVHVPATETITYLGGAPSGTAPLQRQIVLDLKPGDTATAVFVFVAEDDAPFAFPAYAYACATDPGVVSPAEGIAPPPDCRALAGVWMWVETPEGDFVDACVTGENGSCEVVAPFNTWIVVTEDEDTIPPDYSPRENPITARAATEFAQAVFVNLPADQEIPIGGTEILNPVAGRPAHIHAGTCGKLRRTPRYDLTDLTMPAGTPAGSRRATAAETSFSVIDVSLDDLLAPSYAINVHNSHEAMGAYLVCGEIGGVRAIDGSLAVGLREVEGSGYEGIAYLVPDAADPAETDVWVFIAPTLAEEERATPTAEASPGAG